jgi:hypothetical protein
MSFCSDHAIAMFLTTIVHAQTVNCRRLIDGSLSCDNGVTIRRLPDGSLESSDGTTGRRLPDGNMQFKFGPSRPSSSSGICIRDVYGRCIN